MVKWLIDSSKLEPQFRTDIFILLSSSPYPWYVTSGWRGMKEQADLYMKYVHGGPKAAPPGKSAHNFGLAVDVVLDDPNKNGLQMLWSIKLPGWIWLKAAVWKHPRLHSLWSIGDWPHIERYKWYDYKNWNSTKSLSKV